MKEKPSLAVDILNMVIAESFLGWAQDHLSFVESPPWKPRQILPDGRRKRLTNVIEIIGLPESGKSQFINYILTNRISNTRQLVYPELESHGIDGETRSLKSLVNPRAINGLGLEYVNYVIEASKLLCFDDMTKDLIHALKADAINKIIGDPLVTILERGPIDVLAHSSWIASEMSEKEELPPDCKERIIEDKMVFNTDKYLFPGITHDHAELFFQAMARAECVDAVIIFGNSYEIAARRRIMQNKPPESLNVNPSNWPKLEHSYGWILGSVIPLLRSRHGTGYLVVDSQQDLDFNNIQIREYIKQVVALSA